MVDCSIVSLSKINSASFVLKYNIYNDGHYKLVIIKQIKVLIIWVMFNDYY